MIQAEQNKLDTRVAAGATECQHGNAEREAEAVLCIWLICCVVLISALSFATGTLIGAARHEATAQAACSGLRLGATLGGGQ
jgi:hypothetical protein